MKKGSEVRKKDFFFSGVGDVGSLFVVSFQAQQTPHTGAVKSSLIKPEPRGRADKIRYKDLNDYTILFLR
jgi:hypothetical protein